MTDNADVTNFLFILVGLFIGSLNMTIISPIYKSSNSARIFIRQSDLILSLVNETCQTENVSAKARTIIKESVKPGSMRDDIFYDEPYVDHGEKRAGADYIPSPLPEEQVAACYSKHHKSGIDKNLKLWKRLSGDTAQGYRQTFAGHCDRTAFHFKSYAYTHHGATRNLDESFAQYRITQVFRR